MSARIIDGKAVAQKIKDEIKNKVAALPEKPGLAVVIVGDDPASHNYVNNKEKACAYVGFYSEIHRLPKETSEAELIKLIDKLNKSKKIDGFLIQSPLPEHLNEEKMTLLIDPAKDVDCFHPFNTGKVFNGDFTGLMPCTPAGCLQLIKSIGIELKGKKAVVVGRSNIVGKPMAMLLLNEHCTVTICHSRTSNLAAEVSQADIVVAAVGRPKLITGEMIKPGAVVIDVGTNRVNDKWVGDVDFDSVKEKAGFITPVPGGVGPMTIAMLLQNTLLAKQRKLTH